MFFLLKLQCFTKLFQMHLKGLFVQLFILISGMLIGQEKIEVIDFIKENEITKFNSQPLILIDFWATWCGPCAPATSQLEVYQKQLTNEVYMLAFSNENESTIRNYLQRKPIQIAVVVDKDKLNIERFNVPYRPYSVILNSQGKTIWKGKPTELNLPFLKKLAQQQRQFNYELEDLFKLQEKQHENYHKTDLDSLKIKVEKSISRTPNNLSKYNNRVDYEGNLNGLIANLKQLPHQLITGGEQSWVKFSTSSYVWNEDKTKIINFLKDELNLKLESYLEEDDFIEIKPKNLNQLWNTKQIEWSQDDNSKTLITEDRIMADNASLNEVAFTLSKLKDQNYLYLGNDKNKYDWDFHFRYNQFMEDELAHEFQIDLIQHNSKITTKYRISKNKP